MSGRPVGRKLLWVLPVALLAGALVFVLGRSFGTNVREVPFMLKGQQAPAFTLRSLNTGETVSLQALRGKPVVLNFWASWCAPCKLEHPVLEWGARTLGDQVHFVGVVFEDSEENARKYLARNGASFPQLMDDRGNVAVDYGASGVPETYFIDAQGRIVDKHVGPIPPDVLQGWVQRLVAER
jgi:cytochrome c biogenesis protein CcmG/thiol:disulfide interchange protein DsbE